MKAKQKEGYYPKPLPTGFLIVGFFLFVIGVLFGFTERLSATWATLSVIVGLVLMFASFRSLRVE